MVYISSKNQIGDIITKALGEAAFRQLVGKVSLIDIHTQTCGGALKE